MLEAPLTFESLGFKKPYVKPLKVWLTITCKWFGKTLFTETAQEPFPSPISVVSTDILHYEKEPHLAQNYFQLS